jgi:hypothetical protein
MHDELVHVPGYVRIAEACYAVAAGFRGAEGEAEEGIVVGADDGEVVGHFGRVRGYGCAWGIWGWSWVETEIGRGIVFGDTVQLAGWGVVLVVFGLPKS